jgi:hypothetical protein
MADHGFLAGRSLTTKFPIAAGWCSPAPPTKVYERSKPSGPSTLISQLSFARDPTIDTRHSPGLSPSTCSMRATISPRVRESPVFCISTLAAMSPNYCYKAARQSFYVHNRFKTHERRGVSRATSGPWLSKNDSGNCRLPRPSTFEMVLHNFCC